MVEHSKPVNPFMPSFGAVPAVMAGRSMVLAAMRRAFENGRGDPNLSTILVGARGTGKTALLMRIAQEAQGAGWICARSSALPGMLEDIYQCARREGRHLVDSGKSRIVGIEVGQLFGIEWERDHHADENWRSKMTDLLEALEVYDTGLLVTVDEINPTLDEVKTLVAVYQHFVTEGRKVALCMAGLPSKVSTLLSDEDVSFLRRARRQTLGRIGDAEVGLAIRRTLELSGGAIGDDALRAAIAATEGFPFMLQLVGYWIWEYADDVTDITERDVTRAVEAAVRDFEQGVLEVTWDELSAVDKQFVAAMLRHEGDALLADVARDLGVKSNYATKYKKRLIERGVIGEYGTNKLRFEMPYSRRYFAERLAEE